MQIAAVCATSVEPVLDCNDLRMGFSRITAKNGGKPAKTLYAPGNRTLW